MSAEAHRATTPTPRGVDERAALGGLYPFSSHYLETPGGRLHYLDEGPRGAEPLLCVHGNPTWSFYWRRLVTAFRRDRRVVVPDHIGCGLSDKPASFGYRLEGHVENLERLLLALDLRNVTLAVHDWGGPIGLGVARRHPDRIARLVITNTAGFPAGDLPWPLAACRLPGLGAFLVRGLNAFAGLAPRLAVTRRMPPDVRRGLGHPYGSWAERIAVHRFVQDIPMSPEHPSWAELTAIESALPELATRPTCILWGDRDWVFTPRFREEWQRRIPHARVHAFPNAGHLVLEDAGEECERALRTFLSETSAAEPSPA